MALHELDDYRHHGIEPAAGPRTVHGVLPAGDTIATLNDGSTVPVPRIEQPDGWDEYGGALLATVELVGFLHPVDIAPDGTIIDGHRRRWIAQQLNIDLPIVCHPTIENEADVTAVRFALNEARKPGTWTRAQWRQALKELATRKNEAGIGLPVVEIAALMGTTARTVQRHLAKLDAAELPDKRANVDGRIRPAEYDRPPETTSVVSESPGQSATDPVGVPEPVDNDPDLDAFEAALDAALQADDDPAIDLEAVSDDDPADLRRRLFDSEMLVAELRENIGKIIDAADRADAQDATIEALKAEVAELRRQAGPPPTPWLKQRIQRHPDEAGWLILALDFPTAGNAPTTKVAADIMRGILPSLERAIAGKIEGAAPAAAAVKLEIVAPAKHAMMGGRS